MFGFSRRHGGERSSLQHPLRRTEAIVTTETEDEVLIYDETRHHIHHLNPTASTVWRLCDGRRSVGRIAMESGIERESVTLALQKLAQAHLLEGDTGPWEGEPQSRRSFLRKAGMASIPAIVSVTAPTAAAAQSGGQQSCLPRDSNCYSYDACCDGMFCSGYDPTLSFIPGICL